MGEVPELLTVEEAARVMRISRNTAYEKARLYRVTNGEEGLEVVDAGGVMRVPRRRLEERLQITIESIPPPKESSGRITGDPQGSSRSPHTAKDPRRMLRRGEP